MIQTRGWFKAAPIHCIQLSLSLPRARARFRLEVPTPTCMRVKCVRSCAACPDEVHVAPRPPSSGDAFLEHRGGRIRGPGVDVAEIREVEPRCRKRDEPGADESCIGGRGCRKCCRPPETPRKEYRTRLLATKTRIAQYSILQHCTRERERGASAVYAWAERGVDLELCVMVV